MQASAALGNQKEKKQVKNCFMLTMAPLQRLYFADLQADLHLLFACGLCTSFAALISMVPGLDSASLLSSLFFGTYASFYICTDNKQVGGLNTPSPEAIKGIS